MNSPCASKEYRRDRIDMSDETSVHKIAGYTEAVRRLGPFFWTDFPTVKRLHVDRATSGVGEYVVRLTIESDDASASRRVTLPAEGVTERRISEWGGIETRLIGLDCVDISARQWEGKCWQVWDYEHDMIHFYCRDLRIDDVEQ